MFVFETSRVIPASPERVFAAIQDPARLARWWGPNGFTNTFETCEMREGGRWSFVMHGPNGANYPNESVFEEIDPPRRIVIRHVSEPKFRLTIELEKTTAGSLVRWNQTLENEELARKLADIVVPANEQNLDRLSREALA